MVPLEADAAQLAEYENEEGQIANLQGVEARERLANLTRTAYLVKEKALLNWVKCFLESDEKLLLFAWHRDVVDALYDALKEFHPAKIYGGVSLKQREDEKERFISDESCRVMVCNIQSGGTGVDGFQKVCCNVAFAEFAATSTDMEQAEDRLHRGGQERPVNVYYLIAQGTIDEDMAEALDEKKRVLASVLDGKEAKDLDLIATIAARRGLRI
jgi:SNF2 family DNA or RNA helicase